MALKPLTIRFELIFAYSQTRKISWWVLPMAGKW